MIRVVGIIGPKGSGKTYLGTRIAKELTKRGYKVAVIKHTAEMLDFPQKDTARYRECCKEVVAISENETVRFYRNDQSLEDVIRSLKSDFVIVEGFKGDRTFPKIVCLKGEEKYHDDLQIATVIRSEISKKKIEELCDLIEKRSFKLAGLDCKKCGFNSCYDFAKEILKGKTGGCRWMNEGISVFIGGERIFLNPFVSKILKGTIQGFLSNLRGFKKGPIEIEIR